LAEDNNTELLGLAEAASLLGVSRQAIGNWRERREDFPSPVAKLASGPIWRKVDIVAWAEAAGINVSDTDPDGGGVEPGPGVTVALMNMKGGVGKSTLAANLGWFSAYRKNKRVLLVDLDPQFNLSQYLMGTSGYEKHFEQEKATVIDIFDHGSRNGGSPRTRKSLNPKDVIANIKTWTDGSRLDLIPSSLDLARALKNPTEKAQLLAHFLEDVQDSYDLILIDCAPTESMLTAAAYLAAESVLVPVKPEFLSTIGLPLLVSSLDDFEAAYRKSVDILGIVFNASTDKLEHDRSRAFVRKFAEDNGFYVFQNEVAYSDSYPKGSRYGTPIFLTDYARREKVLNFNAVAEEFYARLSDE
jgi:chromosome partitioning protein